MERAVEPLTLSVTFWVVWGGSGLLNAIGFAQVLYDVALKISPLVGVKTAGGPEQVEPLFH